MSNVVDVAMVNVDYDDDDCNDHLIEYYSKAFRQLDDDYDDDELS